VTYVAVKGTRLNRSRDVNLFPPTPAAIPIVSGTDEVGTGVVQQFSTTRPLAAFGAINTFESAASSIYHGMIVSVNNSHDFRITRVFRIQERSRIEFLTEFFNVFNHPNFLFGRDDDGYFRTHSTFATNRFSLTSNFPTPNQAFNPRQIQFALKYLF
jgi:hypothetical protein